MGPPFFRESQDLPNLVGAKERCADPASPETLGLSRQQQVLAGHCSALNRHRPFGSGSPLIGVAVHVLERHANDDHHRCSGDTVVGSPDVTIDACRIVAILLTIGSQPLAHGAGQRLLPFPVLDQAKTPWLAVVRRRRSRGCIDHSFNHFRRHRVGREPTHGAPFMQHIGECLLGVSRGIHSTGPSAGSKERLIIAVS